MFANLSQGSLVYVLSLNDGVKYSVGTVESILTENKSNQFPYTPVFNNGQNMGSHITLKVNLNGKSTDITGLPSNSSIASTSNFIVTENKEAMITQVETLLQNSRNILENIDKHKRTITECEDVLKQINPTFAKESERDETISGLKSKVSGMEEKINKILTILANANGKNK